MKSKFFNKAIKYPARLTAILLLVILVFCSCEQSTSEVYSLPESVPLKTEEKLQKLENGTVIGENDRIKLSVSDNGLTLDDKSTQASWNTVLGSKELEGQNLNRLWKTTAESMLTINYSKTPQNVQIANANPAMSAKTTCYRLKNGIKFCYDFTEVKIKLSLEIFLEENQLVVRVPAADIEEYGKAILMSVEVMQFLGAASNQEDGYYLYPDGSGAIFEFSKLDSKKLATKQYKWTVYGNEDDYLAQDDFQASGNGQFFLPVFGVKKGNAGFAAVISHGAQDANINLYTSAMAVKLNRIYPEFIYRRTYDTLITTMNNGVRTDADFIRIDDNPLLYDREIRYLFLEGEGNYSDMANACRSYFLKTGQLNKNLDKNASLPLGMDFFIGAKKESLFPEFALMSSFQDCRNMLESLQKDGVSTMQVTLEGWSQGGYGVYPMKNGVNSKAGGKSGLKQLGEYVSENGGELFLNVNYLDVSKEVGGYSLKKDLLRNQGQKVIEDKTGLKYLFNPVVASERLQRLSGNYHSYVSGLSFEGFGQTLSADYQKSRRILRYHTVDIWNNMLLESKEQYGKAAVYGGNLFLLNQASRIYDIPSQDSGFAVADETVPFFQMIVHGNMAYSDEPINLMNDKKVQVLKMLEYGYIPYYQLTKESSSRLKETKYNTLFSSCVVDYDDEVSNIYQRFQSAIGDCYTSYMISHQKVAENVYQVNYDNGIQLLFNYREEPAVIDGISIPAMDYIRLEGKVR